MATKIYGASDDLIEVDGDETGEANHASDKPACLIVSDGTMLEMVYGKDAGGIWAITVINKGSLFDRLDICTDEDADPHSDVAHFRDGVKHVYIAKSLKRVK